MEFSCHFAIKIYFLLSRYSEKSDVFENISVILYCREMVYFENVLLKLSAHVNNDSTFYEVSNKLSQIARGILVFSEHNLIAVFVIQKFKICFLNKSSEFSVLHFG